RTSAHLDRRHEAAAAHRVHERVDRGLRRADGAQAARVVEIGARRVEHAGDDALDVEALLGHLRDDDVRVVAVGGGDDRVRVLDPRLAEQVDVHAVADDEGAWPVLAEAREGVLVLVDDGHIPALALELEGDGRADTAAADDQGVHPGCSVAPEGSSSAPCGKATISTSAGDLRRTWSTVGEKKRDWRRQRGDDPRTMRSTPSCRAASTI